MNFPLILEYIEAIKSAEDNFKELSYLSPVLGDDGLPVMTNGNFAVVFKMKDERDGKFYAVKCFTKEQKGRAEAYREIAKELKGVSSPYLVSFRYLEKELFVDTDQTIETEFPVLLMDWVEGKTLDKYLRENLDDKYALEMLAYRFSQLAQWLIPQPFAHGDLKPDNILVRIDGTLVLVDYDGMYVPFMKGQKARELGSPDFRHPLRTEDDFNEQIDNFPIISILLSLKAISYNPELLEKYGAEDRLLLSKKDYTDISKSKLIKELCPSGDKELNNLIGVFLISDFVNSIDDMDCYKNVYRGTNKNVCYLSSKLIDYMSVGNNIDESDGASEEDLRNAWVDKYGALYSKDKKELLKGTADETYRVLDGTISIDSWAFFRKSKLKNIEFPDTLKYIRFRAFSNCSSLAKVILPKSVKRIGHLSFADCSNLANIIIPDGVTCVGSSAFQHCKSLKSIVLPKSLLRIEEKTFKGCVSLSEIILPESLRYIDKEAFMKCSKLKCIDIPSTVEKIGYHSFLFCESLEKVIIHNPFIDVSEYDFGGCSPNLTIYIPCNYVAKFSNLWSDTRIIGF